jgi:ABC-type transport system involved in cytochrome c biogenesis permease subunit
MTPDLPPPVTAARPTPRLDAFVRGARTALGPVASLKITVVLFVFSLLLVFFGTLAQKGMGIWTVVEDYFYSWWVKVELKYLVEFGKIFFGVNPSAATAAWVPLPGGKAIGWAMFVNLLAAHTLQLLNLIDGARKQARRSRSTAADVLLLLAKRSGIYLLHGGVLLLLVGEYITRERAVEQQMTITQGEWANHTIDTKNFELAFVDGSAATEDKVTVVPLKQLLRAHDRGERITHPDLPADFEVLRQYKNTRPVEAAEMPNNPATAGEGVKVGVKRAEEVPGVDMTKEVDIPAVYVKLYKKGTDDPVGVYLMSLWVDDQTVRLGDTAYAVSLRRTHYYKPYKLHLLDFHFDRYVGTQTAKNYASDVRLEDPEMGQDRELTIRMNEPLRHRGETFFQADFDKKTERTTILQVVKNPGWWLPYVSCALVTGGMAVHFAIMLVTFLARTFAGRRNRGSTGPDPISTVVTGARGANRVRVLAVAATALVVAGVAVPRTPKAGRLDLQPLATLPVVDGGRVKPLDTVARVSLRLITHAEEYTDANGDKQPALRWLMDTASARSLATDPTADLHLFRIHNDQVRELLKLPKREGFRYSFKEILAQGEPLMKEVAKADALRRQDRNAIDLYQSKLLELNDHILTYRHLFEGTAPLVVPTADGGWQSHREAAEKEETGEQQALMRVMPAIFERLAAANLSTNPKEWTDEQKAVAARIRDEELAKQDLRPDPAVAAWSEVLSAYRSNDPARYDPAVAKYRELVEGRVSAAEVRRARFETYLNQTGLYYWCLVLYAALGVVGLIGVAASVVAPAVGNAVRRGVFWALLVTFLLHTFTLLARMYLMDRPLVFVTNLYSSAVFIGWGVVGLCLLIELVYPIGVGNKIAAGMGFATCLIAHNLAASGDTLEMMVAVLDTNFWLATHVTTVTLGYSATYVAGLIGLVYVLIAAVPNRRLLGAQFDVGTASTTRTQELGKVLDQLQYAIIAFATLLSFLGTVLGGIWADQSWGRFWGWDPKENGAVLIVLWNALILHARWAGLVKARGTAVLALVGNMITTWSWFGTNQLGVGLHNYGFNNTLAAGCAVTWAVHAGLIVFGLMPWQWVWTGSTAPTDTAGHSAIHPPRAKRV